MTRDTARHDPATHSSGPIFTAGYGNLGFEGFIERIRGLGATHLVDVRRQPGSRYWTDFCRPRLDALVAAEGLRYVWLGDAIGGIGDREVPAGQDGQPDYRVIWREAAFQRGLDRVVEAAGKPGWVICLMCGCLRPAGCHRGFLIGPALLDRGVELMHVEGDGRLVGQRSLLDAAQARLF